jgi:hypothetical protein
MTEIPIENRPMCAVCAQPIGHDGPDYQMKAESLLKSALSAPVRTQSYIKNEKEARSRIRTKGWFHHTADISHDPLPHDNRTAEDENNRFQRILDAEPESMKAIRALVRGTPRPAGSAPREKPANTPSMQSFIDDMSDEELEQWNKNAPADKKAKRSAPPLSQVQNEKPNENQAE